MNTALSKIATSIATLNKPPQHQKFLRLIQSTFMATEIDPDIEKLAYGLTVFWKTFYVNSGLTGKEERSARVKVV